MGSIFKSKASKSFLDSLSAQNLPKRSLLSKRCRFSLYMVQFNFIYTHIKRTVPIFKEPKNVQVHYVYVSNTELHHNRTIELAGLVQILLSL
jgi:hypothetical protein